VTTDQRSGPGRPEPDATDSDSANSHSDSDSEGARNLRFLSPEWFEQVAAERDPATSAGVQHSPQVVLKQVVTGTPFGTVTYEVRVSEGAPAVFGPGAHDSSGSEAPNSSAPDLTITSDWSTACALSAGEISARQALLDGHLKVHGDLAALSSLSGHPAALDPLTPQLRARTSFR
jgi:hypothetical protein